MIDYGKSPSNQSAFPITDEAAFVQEVREWAKENPAAWEYYMMIVRTESAFGELSPAYPLQILRHRRKVSIRNAASPILARMAMEADDSVRFRLAASKYDPYFEVAL